jgi:hypothetical protein
MAVDRKARLAIRQLIRAFDELGSLVSLPEEADSIPGGGEGTPQKTVRDRIVSLLAAQSQVDPDEVD